MTRKVRKRIEKEAEVDGGPRGGMSMPRRSIKIVMLLFCFPGSGVFGSMRGLTPDHSHACEATQGSRKG